MEAIRTVQVRRVAVAQEWLAGGALAAVVVLSYVLAAGMASSATFFVTWSQRPGFGFPSWLAGPLQGTGIELTIPRFMLLTLALYALYLAVVWLAPSVRLAWAVGAIALLHVVWLLAPPMWLTDVFNYLGYVRLGARHGLNPYAHFLQAVPHDPSFRWVTWPKLHSPYGPLFLAGSWPVAWASVPAGLWIFKVATALASLGCIALVARLAQQLLRPVVPAVLFVGLNPLWLVYGVGGAHNDMFMLLFVLGGLLLALRGREALGAGSILLGAAIKATGGILLPFLFVGAKHRKQVVIGAAAAGALVVAIVLVFFGDHPFAALLSFATQGENISFKSFPGQVGQQLLGMDDVNFTLQTVANALLAIVVVGLLYRAWKGRADWLESAGWATLAVLLSLLWMMPWYIVWLLPLAAIVEDRRLRIVALVFGAFVTLMYIP
jgi:glycosyl transferase family 87